MKDSLKASSRKTRLSQNDIVHAALLIIEQNGLSALSARKLATALGCEPMSLYHHFRNMEALHDAIVDRLLTGQSVVPVESHLITQALMQAANSYLEIADAYPNAFQLVATRRWRTPNALAAVRSMVAIFMAAGFNADQALGKSRILAAYLNGAGLAIAAWRKSQNAVLQEVVDQMREVQPSTLGAAVVRADLQAGAELLVNELAVGA